MTFTTRSTGSVRDLLPPRPLVTPQVAKHSSASVEHFTPREVIIAARSVMGGIDLDPASTRLANETIGARRIFTQTDDGLSQRWSQPGGAPSRVWLNPPGGLVGKCSSAKLWWCYLLNEHRAGRVSQAIYLGFNLEILQSSQIVTKKYPPAVGWKDNRYPSAMEFPLCIPSHRLKFLYVDPDDSQHLKVGGGPTHANVIVYLPPRLNRENAVQRFVSVFKSIGACKP